MEEIKNLLEERKSSLLQMKKEKTKALKSVPEGYLRVCRHGKKIQYYHRKDPKDFNGVYIKEKDCKFARKLAQKDYDEKVLRSTEKELKAIEKIALYEQNGIFLGENLILTFETMKNPINRKVIQEIIRRYLR